MRKTMKLILVACLILVVCSFVACGKGGESHVHSYSEWTITKNPSCSEDGIKERDCACGDIQKTPIPATGHVFTWTTTKEATCTTDGSKEGICSCGHSTVTTVSATGHSFGDWTVIKAATCTVDGTEERVCSCGEKETRVVTGSHSWQKATCTTAKKCSKCNLTDGSALGHTYTKGICNRCDSKMEVNLQSVPLTVWYYQSSSMEITDISYNFDSYGDLIISFSGVKKSGGDYIACHCKVFDESGYVICTRVWTGSFSTGEKFRNETIEIPEDYLAGSSGYTIVFSDYKG